MHNKGSTNHRELEHGFYMSLNKVFSADNSISILTGVLFIAIISSLTAKKLNVAILL